MQAGFVTGIDDAAIWPDKVRKNIRHQSDNSSIRSNAVKFEPQRLKFHGALF